MRDCMREALDAEQGMIDSIPLVGLSATEAER